MRIVHGLHSLLVFLTLSPLPQGSSLSTLVRRLIEFLMQPFQQLRSAKPGRADVPTELRALLTALRQGSPVVVGVTEQVRRRLLRRYLDASQRNLPMHLVALAVLLFGVIGSAPGFGRGLLFVVLTALTSLRWWLAERALHSIQNGRPGNTRAHDALLLATHTGWGASPMIAAALAPGTDFFALCLLAVMATGAITMTYLSALPASVALIGGGLGALAISLASHGSAAGWAMAVGTGVAALVIMQWMQVNHGSTLRMFNTERHNQALIAELQGVQQRLALENRKLGESLKDVNEAAERDVLTGAFNRKYLTDIAASLADRVRSHQEPITVCMIDIDHFKRINDRHGHAVGDFVLKAVVEQLNARLRDVDRLARYGGEEFVLILRRCDIGRGKRVAEALRNHIASVQLESPEVIVSITTSIGVAKWHRDESLDAVMERADRALYVAKNKGRDRVQIDIDDEQDESLDPSQPAPITRT